MRKSNIASRSGDDFMRKFNSDKDLNPYEKLKAIENKIVKINKEDKTIETIDLIEKTFEDAKSDEKIIAQN